MDKIELKKRLAEVQNRIKANSKDVHFADELSAELLSIKGQLDIEPTLVHIPISENAKTLQGDTFEMVSDTMGCAFHTFGGYTIYAKRNDGNNAFCDVIDDYVANAKERDNMTEEEKKSFDSILHAIVYCLNAPMLCCSDAELLFKVATDIVDYLVKVQEEALNADLKEETLKENEEFEGAMKAIENIKEQVDKEEN